MTGELPAQRAGNAEKVSNWWRHRKTMFMFVRFRMAHRYDQPDAGYAWVILAANFVLHILASSALAPFGIFLVEYLERFNQSKANTAGIVAAHLAIWGLSGKTSINRYMNGTCTVNWSDTLIRYIMPALTHWGRDKMAAFFQTTFGNEFSWMKIYEFQLEFHWSLFPGVQLTILRHWFR